MEGSSTQSPGVGTKWTIPLYLFFFAAFILAMWVYVAGDDEEDSKPSIDKSRRNSRVSLDVKTRTNDSSNDGQQNLEPIHIDFPNDFPSIRNSLRPPSIAKQLHRSWTYWQDAASTLAIQIDRIGVRLRSNLGRSPSIQLISGWHALRVGQADDAVRHFDRLLQREPNNTSALAGKASALTSLGRYQEAADHYERVVRLSPRDVQARFNYGVLLTRQSRYSLAAIHFRAAVRRRPDHAKAQFNLATLAQRDGRLAEARDAWEDYTRLRPEDVTGWFNLGIICMDFLHPAQAAYCFTCVVAANPEDPAGYVNLALAYMSSDEIQMAFQALAVADEQFPCEPAVMQVLAGLHRRMAIEDPSEEMAHLSTAARLSEQLSMIESEDALMPSD